MGVILDTSVVIEAERREFEIKKIDGLNVEILTFEKNPPSDIE